jgi:hypothetical protein
MTLERQVELQETALRGAGASALAAQAEIVVAEQEARIRRDIFTAIDSREPLDPQKAIQAWLELRSAYKFVSSLRKVKNQGVSASEQLQAASKNS